MNCTFALRKRGRVRMRGGVEINKKTFANGDYFVTFALPERGTVTGAIPEAETKTKIVPSTAADIEGEPRGEPTKFFKR